mgnify:CR=1 FL=1
MDTKRWDTGRLSVWGLALGCIVGWGAFVLPGTTFIPSAGVVGTIIGIVIGTLISLTICACYSWMVHLFPEERGSYTYTRHILGEDHAFLAAWSILLTYLSIMWANASTLVMLLKNVVSFNLQFGYMYTIVGYDIYASEALITIALLIVFGLITSFWERIANILRVVFALSLFISVIILFVGMLISGDGLNLMHPAFSTSEPLPIQILNIVVFAPFLFVGFETVTHLIGIIPMKSTRIYSYAAIAIVCSMAIYIMLALSAVLIIPDGCTDIRQYLIEMHKEQGIATLPAARNARELLGDWGVVLVVIAVISALMTGVMGFHRGAARIVKIMAKAELLPAVFGHTRKDGVATNASLLVLVISLPTVLLGRVAIGWNSEVGSFGATIVFAYIATCTILSAKNNKKAKTYGWIGLISTLIIFLALMLPSIFYKPVLNNESYLLLGFWSLSGMVYYWWVFLKDKKHRFGKSTIMWLIVSSILFFSVTLYTQTDLYDSLAIDHEMHHHHLVKLLAEADMIQIFTVAIILFFLFSLFTIMTRRERELHLKFVQSEKDREEMTIHNEILQLYNDKLIEQKTQIEQLHFELEKSIHYAHNIQHSLLTPKKEISKIFANHFVLYKPRNIVSGDFYWISEVGNFKICAVADCTGHGVPGGFISMLGMTNLNYICANETSPELILEKLRQAIIKSLRQTQNSADDNLNVIDTPSTDGMDMAIYVINSKDNTLAFSGANNPLLIARNGEMIVIRGDKMPVGIYVTMDNFSRQEFQLQPGDVLYTFSDGFQDQFGIETNKKFKSKNLREFLLSISNKPMDEQAQILNDTFEKWRGPIENQTDDVLIMGVKIEN